MRNIAIFVISLFAYTLSAQVQSVDGGMAAYRKIVKDDCGSASLLAFYKISFLKDSTQRSRYSEAQCVLQISDSFLCFGDYYQLMADSLETEFIRNRKSGTEKNMNMWDQAINKLAFQTKVLTDLSSLKIRVQLFTGLRDYEYSASQPTLKWNLIAGDSVINDVSCKKPHADMREGIMRRGMPKVCRCPTDLTSSADCQDSL